MIEYKIKSSSELESAILINVAGKRDDIEQIEEYLDELEFLALTYGAETKKRFIQRLERPDKSTYIGKGKILEIKEYIEQNNIQLLIFDDELSPAQQKNLEKELKKKILDRNFLILQIFAQRAQTAYAKTQVDLAYYQYMLPRLVGLWTHLERQRGGTGTRSGAGEKEIETDRRIIRDKISLLKEKLIEIDKQMVTQRKSRGELIRVALVGYTNVGKSTIMNMLSKSEVFAENKLFATLDTTTRKVVIDNIPFLLSDTVGFIRKLPHQLVESFKSTLDEAREADLLLHVVDISHKNFEEQIQVVTQTLTDIKASDKPTIIVFNKIDAYKPLPVVGVSIDFEQSDVLSLDDLKKTWMNKLNNACVFISASNKENIEEFKKIVYDKVKELHIKRYPYNNFLY
jgi:GTP-binding protein HflX